MGRSVSSAGYLEGQLLVATPMVSGSCFDKAVIYTCVHNENGAMGIIINHRIENLSFDELLHQLKIANPESEIILPIHFGGPVDTSRGFILHSNDFRLEDTLMGKGNFALTSNIDILKEIASGRGPRESMLVLGYAGWGPGQLETEMESGSWITVPATHGLVFGSDNANKWVLAGQSLGIDMSRLHGTVGHA